MKLFIDHPKAIIDFTGYLEVDATGFLQAQFAICSINDWPVGRPLDLIHVMEKYVDFFDEDELRKFVLSKPDWKHTVFDSKNDELLRDVKICIRESEVLRAIKAIREYRPK